MSTKMDWSIKMPLHSRYVQKCRQWRNWRFWRNSAKVVAEIIRASKLTQLEGPRNVGEFGKNREVGKSGDFGKISPMIRANKLTQFAGPQNVGENGEFGESGDFGKISPMAKVIVPRNVGEFGENGEFGKSGDFGEISPSLLTK